MRNFDYDFNENIIYKKVKSSDGDNTTIVMAHNKENGEMYEFNDVASEIFEMMYNKTKVSDIYKNLCECYNVTEDVISEDVEEFFDRLIDLKIITIK